MGRILGLDIGDKRIGIAVSDETGTLARPLSTLTRGAKRDDFVRLQSLCVEYHIEKIVAGLPKTLRGEIGPQARHVQRYADELSAAVGLPIEFWDERFSSIEAQERLATSGRKKRKAKGAIDTFAAAIILQEYLDATINDK